VSKEYAFDRDEVRIGRSPLNDLSIPVEGVSVRHGRMRLRGETLFFEDLDSLHGTHLRRDGNRERLEGERSLLEGDILELGPLSTVELCKAHLEASLGDALVQVSFDGRAGRAALIGRHLEALADLALEVAANPEPTTMVSGVAKLLEAFGRAPVSAGYLKHGRGPVRFKSLEEGRLVAGQLDMMVSDKERLISMLQRPCLIHHPTASGVRLVFAAVGQPDPHAAALVYDLSETLDAAALETLTEVGACLVPLLRAVAKARNARDERESLAGENRYFRERQRQHYLFKELITESESMKRVYKRLSRLVESPGPVLIVGEAGSGKELIARAVHHLSERSASLMVTRRCTDQDHDLFDLELFGSGRRGHPTQMGILELADGGTVFLNQVERLPLLLQSKLVRVIKEGELRRHGEEMARTVDVRLVLSTHTELSQLVAEGVFRKDLHVALKDSVLKVPPMRERQDDLLPLVHIFLGVFCRRFGLSVPRVGEIVETKLRAHNWPGNVRELQGAVESAVLKHRDGVVTARDFGF
jgi:hypothetical protein